MKSSAVTFFIVLVIDQLSKYLAKIGTIRAEVTQNPGLPFVGKILPGFFDFALILAALLVFVWLYFKYLRGVSDFGFGLIIGGAVSNIVDRVFSGGVTDFIDIGLSGSFNIADVAIWLGILILLLKTAKKSDKEHYA